MRYSSRIYLLFGSFFLISFLSFGKVYAQTSADSDGDGLSDEDEMNFYYTDPLNEDTDGDGFSDGVEVKNRFSPLHPGKIKYADIDTDGDLLNDELEIRFRTNIKNKDTDGDGFSDKVEIDNFYDPKTKEKKMLSKKIEISISKQRIGYVLDGVTMGEYIISTGKNNSTPRGTFYIGKKNLRAWSRSAKLWMPFWMPFDRHLYGLHELPEWPNGKKEGQSNLGKAVSGGCVRLGIGDAKKLYEWTPEGTPVIIK